MSDPKANLLGGDVQMRSKDYKFDVEDTVERRFLEHVALLSPVLFKQMS